MSSGTPRSGVFRRRHRPQRRPVTAPTQEYLIRHSLESFPSGSPVRVMPMTTCSKGGILLCRAYGVRRPTKDADANAISADVTAATLPKLSVTSQMRRLMTASSSIDTITVQEIRERAEYPGLRVRVKANIGSWQESPCGTSPPETRLCQPRRCVSIESW